MLLYWGSDFGRKRRYKFKLVIPQKGWDKHCGTEVCHIDGGRRKYILGEDVWVGNDGDEGGNEGWFLSLEEVVCDHNYADLDAETILLHHLGFIEAE